MPFARDHRVELNVKGREIHFCHNGRWQGFGSKEELGTGCNNLNIPQSLTKNPYQVILK
jgi:hypothetical protein